MPNLLQVPILNNTSNYPPAIAQALQNMFVSGCSQILTFPVDFTLADGAVLFTVPTGLRLQIHRGYWEPTTSFTGGASSAIGLSSSNASYATKGDLLGGAAGDLAAGLTAAAPFFKGTIGTKNASQGVVVLVGGDTIRFDRIASAFTAGAGNAHVQCALVPAS